MGMDTEVPVKLTDTEIAERAQVMAAKVLHVDHLRKKKAADAKNAQTLIDADLDEIARLARVITEAQEGRRQAELFVDQATAASALAEVEKRATCDGEREPCDGDHKPPACADPECWQRDEPSPEDRDPERDRLDEPLGGEA